MLTLQAHSDSLKFSSGEFIGECIGMQIVAQIHSIEDTIEDCFTIWKKQEMVLLRIKTFNIPLVHSFSGFVCNWLDRYSILWHQCYMLWCMFSGHACELMHLHSKQVGATVYLSLTLLLLENDGPLRAPKQQVQPFYLVFTQCTYVGYLAWFKPSFKLVLHIHTITVLSVIDFQITSQCPLENDYRCYVCGFLSQFLLYLLIDEPGY